MSEHLGIQKFSAYFWAVIVVTSGCGLILLALNSPMITKGDHQQVKVRNENNLLVQTPTLGKTLERVQVVQTRAVPASEDND